MVVYFSEEGNGIAMETISSKWIEKSSIGHFCYWPVYIKQVSKISKLIQDHADINIDIYQKCTINIKYKSSK